MSESAGFLGTVPTGYSDLPRLLSRPQAQREIPVGVHLIAVGRLVMTGDRLADVFPGEGARSLTASRLTVPRKGFLGRQERFLWGLRGRV